MASVPVVHIMSVGAIAIVRHQLQDVSDGLAYDIISIQKHSHFV